MSLIFFETIRSVLLRPSGMITLAEVHEVEGAKPLREIELLIAKIQNAGHSEIPTTESISVITHFFEKK